MMTLATTPGSVIIDRWGALISVTWACARLAMNSCSAGVMMWSAVPTTSQDGMVCQAGTPDWSVNVLVARGRWVAASTAPARAGRPLAKQPGNTVGLPQGTAPDGETGSGRKVTHVHRAVPTQH